MINPIAIATAIGVALALSAPGKPTKKPYEDMSVPTKSAYDLARSPLPLGQPQWVGGNCVDVRHINSAPHLNPHCSP